MNCVTNAWTASEDEFIVEGILQGWTWQRIADDLPGRTSRTARLRADRLGIRPKRKLSEDDRCPIEGSRLLLEEMEHAFALASRKWGVDYLDARTLLMNAVSL